MAFGGLKGNLSVAANSITATTSATGSVVVVVGDLVYAVIGEQTGNTTTACGDNLGNSYTALSAGTLSGSACSGHAYYSRVTVAGTLTSVNFTCTGSANNVAAIAAVIEGPFATSPLDANPANITSDVTSPFTGPATGTLTQPNEVVLSWGVANYGTVWTATSPNLLALDLPSQAVVKTALGYQLVAATTSVAPVFAAASNPSAVVSGTSSFKGLQTWSYVTSYSGNAFGAPIAITVTLNAGDSVNVWVEVSEDTTNTVSVTDNASPSTNTYSSGTKFVLNSAFNIFPLYAINIPHSATTLTVTYSGAANVAVFVDQYTGEGAATLNAQANRSQITPGTATNAVSASTTSIGASNDRNCAFTYSNTQIGTIAAGTGYTGRFASGGVARTEDKFGAGTGSFTASSASDNFMSLMMTFTPSAGPALGTFAGSAAGGIAVGAIERAVAAAALPASGVLTGGAIERAVATTSLSASGALSAVGTASSAGGNFVYKSSTTALHTDAASATTGAIDTTGADLIVAVIWYYFGWTAPTISDSKSNTGWATAVSNNPGSAGACIIYYVRPTTVGTGHTFTMTGGSNGGMVVAAFSGSASSPLDQVNGSSSFNSTTDSGSVSPTQNNELVITVVCATNVNDTFSIGSGYAIPSGASILYTPSSPNAYGGALAYQIQTTAVSGSTTWTTSTGAGNAGNATAIASFKAAPAGGGPITGSFVGSGVGAISAGAVLREVGTVSLPGAGSLTAAAIERAVDTAVLSASGVLSTTAFPGQFVAPVLSGSGVLTAAAIERAIDTAALSASGVLTAAAIETAIDTAVLSASGALSATAITGGTVWQGVSALSGSGVLTAAAIEQAVDTAVLSASGVLTAAAIERAVDTAALSASGVLSAVGGLGATTWQGVAALAGSGVLTAAAIEQAVDTAVLSASGVLTAAAIERAVDTAALSASGVLSAIGSVGATTWQGVASLAGSGVLTAAAIERLFGTASLSASGVLATAAIERELGSALLSASGVLTATPFAPPAGFVLKSWTTAVHGDGSSLTTGNIDTTGADLLVAVTWYYFGWGLPVITDSKVNDANWTVAVTNDPGVAAACNISYVQSPIVGTGHNFTMTPGANGGMVVAAFSGSASSPLDQVNGSSSFNSTISSGTVTPSENNELVITGVGAPNVNDTLSVDSGYAIPSGASILYTPSSPLAYGGALAYLIQTAAATTNTTWTVSTGAGNSGAASAIATFKARAGPSLITGSFLGAGAGGLLSRTAGRVFANIMLQGEASLGTPDLYLTDENGNIITDENGNPIVAVPGVPPGAVIRAVASAILSASGQLIATAVPPGATTWQGVAALSGSGVLASAAIERALGTASLAGSGVLTAAAIERAVGSAVLSGSGVLSAVGSVGAVTWQGVAALAGSGVLTSAAVEQALGTASLSASGVLTAAAIETAVDTAVLSASGVLTAAAIERALGTASLAGSGVLSAVGSVGAITWPGVAALSGSGALTAAAVLQEVGSAVLSGAGLLTTAAILREVDAAILSGSGVLTAAAIERAVGAAVLSGSGVLTETTIERALARALLSASGQLIAIARSKSERPPPPPARLTIRGYPAVPLWQVTSPQTWSARLGDILKTVRQGKQNITLPVTLATGVTTTTITDVRISAICGIVLVPTTAHAVAIQSSVYVSAQKSGEATLTHSSTANTDCNFTVVLIG